MAEYIERERFKHHLENCIDECKNTNGCPNDFEICLKAFQNQPTADVVEVVRCKDCTEWDKDECECSHWYGFRENDFCSYGKHKSHKEVG